MLLLLAYCFDRGGLLSVIGQGACRLRPHGLRCCDTAKEWTAWVSLAWMDTVPVIWMPEFRLPIPSRQEHYPCCAWDPLCPEQHDFGALLEAKLPKGHGIILQCLARTEQLHLGLRDLQPGFDLGFQLPNGGVRWPNRGLAAFAEYDRELD